MGSLQMSMLCLPPLRSATNTSAWLAVRYEYAGATYHVMARGMGGNTSSWMRRMQRDFCSAWRRFVSGVVGRACVWADVESLSSSLGNTGGESRGWNARQLRRGHVFQSRYNSIPVSGERAEDGSYFRVTADYVHLNCPHSVHAARCVIFSSKNEVWNGLATAS